MYGIWQASASANACHMPKRGVVSTDYSISFSFQCSELIFKFFANHKRTQEVQTYTCSTVHFRINDLSTLKIAFVHITSQNKN